MNIIKQLPIIVGFFALTAAAQDRPSRMVEQADSAIMKQNSDDVLDESVLVVERNIAQSTWVDDKRYDTKDYLNEIAHRMDKWFGTTDPNEPARASLRVMMDAHWSEYDGTTIKPRVRGKLKLPTLENRLSLVFGDENLDVERDVAIYNDERAIGRANLRFDRHKTREQNTSFGLRWSKFQESLGVDTDVNLGVRSDDIFIKMRAEKEWKLPKNIGIHYEQVYRYGSNSNHYALSTLKFGQPQSATRTLINRTQLNYTKQDTDEVNWNNSLYQQHRWQGKRGHREFSYGIYAGGDIQNKKASINVYGPYVSYRQPVWREWLFLQGNISYYNNKFGGRGYHVGAFGRVEMVF